MAIPAFALVKHFTRLKDPRCRGRSRHRLIDIITIAICAVICGADNWQKIAIFGHKRKAWLETFLSLSGGVPSHDTFERVFARLDPQAFQAGCRQWVQSLCTALGLKHIAIDGKALRGSADRRRGLGPLHLVSAWASAQKLSLGQVAVDAKSNEITALPELLRLLDVRGALVTIDAMGCQKKVAAQIVAQKGDYALTVKDNQAHLRADMEASFLRAYEEDLSGWQYDEYQTSERGHGRTETRWYTVLYNLEGIRDVALWSGLQAIGQCVSERTVGDKTSTAVRYFIGSRRASAQEYGEALRDHWGIENNLHWQLDVTFREDANRTGERQAAENFALLRRMALMLLKRHSSNDSMASKQFQAALDPKFLEEILKTAENLEEL
jgi:predicted transposase YbfD/YdcC